GSNEDVVGDPYYTNEDKEEVNPEEHEGAILIHVDWSVQDTEDLAEVTEQVQIFDQIQLDEQKGDLRADDVDIATYKNHQDGTVEIKFNDNLDALKDLEGTFVIKGEIEAEEEQATEEGDTSGEAASDGDRKSRRLNSS